MSHLANVEASIRAARDVALGILKPSERDLQHGLELHRDSVVVESYGLGVMGPVDAKAMAAGIEAGASPLELQDIAGDSATTGWLRTPELKAEYEAAWDASGVTCTFQNAGEEGNDPAVLIKRLARHTHMTDMQPDFMMRAIRPDDVPLVKASGKHCVYLTGNGVPLPQDWVSVPEELRYIRVFHQLGCRMMHLTYNRRNMIGDGCTEPANAGLSDFGREVVREMNRAGVIVDIAHSGWQTGFEAADVSEKPIVISHAAAWSVNEHARSKSDELIRAVVEKGGTMGITNVPPFLGRTGDIAALLDHIDHVAKTFGVEAVTIGTDRPYQSLLADAAWEQVPSRGRSRTRWEALWSPDDPLFGPEWKQESMVQSLLWTNWPLFTVGLVQRGYSDDDIRKIVGGNILRVARDVWEG